MRLPVRTVTTAAGAIAVALGGLAVPAANAGHSATPQFKTVAYFTQWGIYGRQYFVRNVATSGAAARLTHLNYAFANVGETGQCFEANIPGQGDAWADFQRPVGAEESVDGVADVAGQPLMGSFNQLRKLKRQNPRLSVQISIGGWSWSKFFSVAAASRASREAFVASCVDLFIRGNLPQLDGSAQGGPGSGAGVFDGIDLDWEWPGSEGNPGNVISPADRHNFTLLVAEFRRQLDAAGRRAHRHYTLTAFLPADPAKIDAGFEAGRIFRYLDFATVQGYDFHGPWETTTNHQSAVFTPAGQPTLPDFTAERAIDAWISRGAPRRELVLGVPFYGHGWTGVNNADNGLFQPATGGAAPGTFEAGSEDYKVLAGLTGKGYTLFRDPRSLHAWLFNGSTFWTFDDPVVLRAKTAYIRTKGLGGAMAWSLDGDDPTGSLVKALAGGLR